VTVAHDRFWIDAASFVSRHASPDSVVVAPKEFVDLIPNSLPYEKVAEIDQPDVLVLHKGQLNALGDISIDRLTEHLGPVFANEVFVIYQRGASNPEVIRSIHFRALQKAISGLVRPTAIQPPRDSRMAIYLGDHVALTSTVYGRKIYVDTRDCSLAPHILLDGYWEKWITDVFRRLVQPGMHVIDIGANVGWYSILAADLIGSSGKLTSFEANPDLSSLVYRNMMVNGFLDRATVVSKAVYNECRSLEFKIYDHHLGSSSIFATSAAAAAAAFNDTIKSITVDAITLDNFFSHGTRVDFIKIDAEGAEPYILQGAARLLRDNPNVQIMMEFAPSIIANAYNSVEKFYNELQGLGFSVWRVAHDSSLVKSNLQDLTSTDHCDVLLKR